MFQNLPSTTAEAVCLIRAYEHAKPAAARIIDDPYAHWFLGPVLRTALSYEGVMPQLGTLPDWATDGIVGFVAARHRYIDDALRRASRRIEQVVLLGAGYDTRAYRFARELRRCTVFEVDHPATARRKARILARRQQELPPATVVRVEVDFEQQSFRRELEKAGFESGQRTFFVWEGVSMYLSRAGVKATLETIRAMSGAGSELAMDFWYLPDEPNLVSSARRWSTNLLSLLGEPVTFGLHPEDAGPFLQRLGFRLRELADAETLCRRYFDGRTHLYPTNYLVHAVVDDGPIAPPLARKGGRARAGVPRPRGRARAVAGVAARKTRRRLG
ncbi:MAG TPA: SAM-dependent methyltransferase [Candidatus Dormibacteraeota bacterium]|nr:SAM-dependent methyltransferase [Candidatus Dormibacteraeota bacterium]